MALTKRVEILFDPNEYRCLEQAAKVRGETVAALVRRAVTEKYVQADMEKRRAAAERLTNAQEDFSWEEAKQFLNEDFGRKL